VCCLGLRCTRHWRVRTWDLSLWRLVLDSFCVRWLYRYISVQLSRMMKQWKQSWLWWMVQ
jgi:hypothetical protein